VSLQAALSAAAVVGCFSWPAAADSFWLGRLMWHCSFWLSIFALISSVHERMLAQIPDKLLTVRYDNLDLNYLLGVLLRRVEQKGRDNTSTVARGHVVGIISDESVQKAVDSAGTTWEIDPALVWIWQAPVMLMNYSWITFLVGYECYLLTPLINSEHKTWNTAKSVSNSDIEARAGH
jgi:hypothetical protein